MPEKYINRVKKYMHHVGGSRKARRVTINNINKGTLSRSNGPRRFLVLQGEPLAVICQFVTSTSLHAAEAWVKALPKQTGNHVHAFGLATRFLEEAQSNRYCVFSVSAAGIKQVNFLCSPNSEAAEATVNNKLGGVAIYVQAFWLSERFLTLFKSMSSDSSWQQIVNPRL